jgi:hypothetical protein
MGNWQGAWRRGELAFSSRRKPGVAVTADETVAANVEHCWPGIKRCGNSNDDVRRNRRPSKRTRVPQCVTPVLLFG